MVLNTFLIFCLYSDYGWCLMLDCVLDAVGNPNCRTRHPEIVPVPFSYTFACMPLCKQKTPPPPRFISPFPTPNKFVPEKTWSLDFLLLFFGGLGVVGPSFSQGKTSFFFPANLLFDKNQLPPRKSTSNRNRRHITNRRPHLLASHTFPC